MSLRLSVLDLSPVPAGAGGPQALQNTLDLARTVDRLGYTRYWLAEHHNMLGLASPAPEIVIGHVAQVTNQMRVGSGGVMLPNHAPLKVAENFRVLAGFHPGRIDLGIGRAPGTDPVTAYALRKSHDRARAGADDFPEQLAELLAFAEEEFPDGHPFRAVRAMPNDVPLPPIWLLGSSTYSAQLAAEWGLHFAFAHHINPDSAIPALTTYREHFKPSAYLDRPQSLMAIAAICAETEEAAAELALSVDLVRIRLQQGRFDRVPTPQEARDYAYSAAERDHIRHYRQRMALGTPDVVHSQIESLAAQTGAEEVMVTTVVHNHRARVRSYELLAEVFGLAGS